ncbi:MAG: radical SAM protein [uncultured bacterium]|nr:MAG: radical SAM protein [uncultured bacterium]
MSNRINVLLFRAGSFLINDNKTNFIRNVRPPFILKYLDAILKNNNINCDLADGAIISLTTLNNLILSKKYDLIIAHYYFQDHFFLLDFFKSVKISSKCEIIVFGKYATKNPNFLIESNPNIDGVIPGEPETIIIPLIHHFIKFRTLKNSNMIISSETNPIPPHKMENLNELPFPIYSPLEYKKYSFYNPLPIKKHVHWGHILTSRGCPNFCNFCTSEIAEKIIPQYRTRDISNILSEILIHYKNGVNMLNIADDLFTNYNNQHISFSNELINNKLQLYWSCHAHIDFINPQYLKIMKKSGCILLRFGIETFNQNLLTKLNKTKNPANWVKNTSEVFLECKKLGIKTIALFIIGLPEQTESDIYEDISIIKKLNPDFIQTHIFTPYPDTALYDKYKLNLDVSSFPSSSHYEKYNNSISTISELTLKQLQKKMTFANINIFYLLNHIKHYIPFYIYNTNILLKLLKTLYKILK